MSARAMDTAALNEKVPYVARWVDNAVRHYEPMARPVISLGFTRLPRYFHRETLQRAQVVVVDEIPKPPLSAMGLPQFANFEQMDANGITYRNTYFVRRDHAARESLHFHELVHVIQWQLLGPERFILEYATGLVDDYDNNPFEVSAYALEARFCEGREPFSVETAVRQDLERMLPAFG